MLQTNKNDLIAVNLCYWAYRFKNRDIVRGVLYNKFKATNVQFHNIKETDMQFITCIIAGKKWIAIRGTKGKQDIFTDLNFSFYDPLLKKIIIRAKHGKKWYKEYKKEIKNLKKLRKQMKLNRVHFGFFKSAKSIFDYLTKEKFKPDCITGHSLGGGVGNLLAMFYKKLSLIITFGAPRSGGILFAKKFNKLFGNICRRFYNDMDAVVWLPLRIMFYMHVKTAMYFDHNGMLAKPKKRLKDFISFIKGRRLKELATDHFLDLKKKNGYIQNIINNMEK